MSTRFDEKGKIFRFDISWKELFRGEFLALIREYMVWIHPEDQIKDQGPE